MLKFHGLIIKNFSRFTTSCGSFQDNLGFSYATEIAALIVVALGSIHERLNEPLIPDTLSILDKFRIP